MTQAEPAPDGLKKNAIGYISNIVIGVASTAPGYSIAATLGFVLAIEGVGHDARVLVVGAHGESPIKGALLGSTAHKLLHLSERPVLVVPAG